MLVGRNAIFRLVLRNKLVELKKKLITNKTKVTQTDPPQKQSNKWTTFTFHGPPVHGLRLTPSCTFQNNRSRKEKKTAALTETL